MKTQTWHRILTHYPPLYFPEIARFAGNSRSDWFLALIERFPTPASITALNREAFSAAAWPLIGRKVSKACLINDIYETASASTALPVPEDSAAITMFRMVIAQSRSLIHQRDEIEQLAHVRLADHVDYQLLRNIRGSGRSTRRPSWPRQATCAASATIVSSYRVKADAPSTQPSNIQQSAPSSS